MRCSVRSFLCAAHVCERGRRPRLSRRVRDVARELWAAPRGRHAPEGAFWRVESHREAAGGGGEASSRRAPAAPGACAPDPGACAPGPGAQAPGSKLRGGSALPTREERSWIQAPGCQKRSWMAPPRAVPDTLAALKMFEHKNPPLSFGHAGTRTLKYPAQRMLWKLSAPGSLAAQ